MTRPQRDVLEIVALGQLMGSLPSIRELAAVLGVASTGGVRQKLYELGARGLVTSAENKARAVEVTALGWAALGWPACGECGRFMLPRCER